MKKYLYFLFLIVFVQFQSAFAQSQGSLKGVVRTSDGRPAQYVNLLLKGSGKGATTNQAGEYVITNIKPGKFMLVISLVGHETLEQTVEVKSGEETIVPEITLNEGAEKLAEIVISGSKLNFFDNKESEYVSKISLKKMENPQVYSAITKELLKEQLLFSVDDAVKNSPGVQKMWEATGRSGDGGAYYNVRGFVLQSQLRNGIAGNVTSRIDAANLERVEVIKGPSATLFGSTLTSYGGLINRVTKKPFEKTAGEITLSTGSFGFSRVSADVNAPLTEKKDILFRLNTAYQNEGSFQDYGFSNSFAIAPSLTYKVNDKLTLQLDTEIYSGKNGSKQMIFFYYPAAQLGATRADQLGIDYNRAYSTNSIYQTSSNTNLFGQLTYRFSNNWTSQSNFTSTRSFSNGPGAYFYVIPNSVVTGNSADTGADYLVRADQSTANNVMQVTEVQQNFLGDFSLANMRHRFVGGLDLFYQNSNQLFYGVEPFDIIKKNGVIPQYANFNGDKLDSALQNGSPWKYPYNYKTKSFSTYVSDAINLRDNLIVSAAIRMDHFNNVGSFDETTGEYKGAYQQTVWSPKFGVVYQPIPERVALFANYQNGFTNKTGTDYAGNIFKPEQANQWEAGVKLDAAQGKLSSTISYYDIEVENLVRPYPSNPNFSIQDGTQRSKGFEVEVIANPFRGFNMVGGFAYNDSEYTKSEVSVQGRRPTTAMSPLTANLWMSYKLANGFGIGVGGNYASDNKIMNSTTMGIFILPSYTLLNTTIFYDQTKFRFGLKVDNLTDQKYWIGYTTMNPQMPRSIVGSISLKF